MVSRLWRKFIHLLCLGGVAAVLLSSGAAYAADQDDLPTLKEQLEQQKKQIEELQKKLGQIVPPTATLQGDPAAGLPAVPVSTAAPPAADKASVESIVADYLKRQDEAKKAQEAAAKAAADADGFKVGTDLRMSVYWNPLNGVTFATPNRDFVSHFGMRFQLDNVWWNQNANTKSLSQIGDLQDGSFFRRLRPQWDGQAYEVVEWFMEPALEQINNDVINYDQMWVGLMNIPYVGNFRIGHLKTPQGLEGDNTGSSKAMTFLERSSFADAFYQNFSTGVWSGNSVLNQRLTWAFEFYRQDNDNQINQTNNAVSFQDGTYGYSGRITALPIWQNDGRCFLHLGLSYSFRDSERSNSNTATIQGGTVGERQVDFRARPQMRDGIGDYGSTNVAGTVLTGDTKRIVDTGLINAPSNQAIGTEMFYVRGPFSFVAEYAWAAMDNATATAGTNLFHPLKAGSSLGTPWFDGGYVQASYFLTGENRTYDRRLGTIGGTYIASPFTPFWLTKGEDGKWLVGRGAWELAARWNYLDLNNGDIAGGKTNALELGLNWYLNTNWKFQFMYLWQDRYQLKPGQVPGDIEGFGIRTQMFF